MKIYIAYTGGTIGMAPSDHGLIPDAAFALELTKRLEALPELEHEFVVNSYETLIDSSNATPKDWAMIARDIESKWQEYDAFIVLHGTDTMAYTAAALTNMFMSCTKPIIVTGSQVPLYQARSDAMNNVLGAISACEEKIKGVFLFFAGLLIEGDRARKTHTGDWQAFSSPNLPEYGVLGIDWKWRDSRFSNMLKKPPMKMRIPDMAEDAVTILPVFPSVQAEHWQGLLNENVKGAVLLSYGAGNAPDKNADLLSLLKTATDRGVVVVNVSQCGAGNVVAGAYAAGSALVAAGVTSGRDMTYEAAFAKLHFFIGLGFSSREIRGIFDR
ncbi:asparaginase domain-containing protein [Marinomonas sp. GJ51-6]|uniref:asparaginase domain-containing protein n=1 Tax=Marinomonas sp. GJ51-6 TaxID=2992802 RepID=UPI0029348DE9|nr:asparaginase domain-containing protein [Marinomonas sp. GJ51-6]WOD08701.1 asparaginase domain-containing protein [Marinomonas sp. GJ51-6]